MITCCSIPHRPELTSCAANDSETMYTPYKKEAENVTRFLRNASPFDAHTTVLHDDSDYFGKKP